MENTANYITQRLSLRKPQKENLEILEKIESNLEPKVEFEPLFAIQ